MRFNRCVAHIYEFANALSDALGDVEKAPAEDFRWALREAGNILIRLFHPMMPHLAEECWAALGHKTLVGDRGLAPGRAGFAGGKQHYLAGSDQW